MQLWIYDGIAVILETVEQDCSYNKISLFHIIWCNEKIQLYLDTFYKLLSTNHGNHAFRKQTNINMKYWGTQKISQVTTLQNNPKHVLKTNWLMQSSIWTASSVSSVLHKYSLLSIIILIGKNCQNVLYLISFSGKT